MKNHRLSIILRAALPWLAFASGDPSALNLIQRQYPPSLDDQMKEILQAISKRERDWLSRPTSTRGEL
jgi:hypothetical protein